MEGLQNKQKKREKILVPVYGRASVRGNVRGSNSAWFDAAV